MAISRTNIRAALRKILLNVSEVDNQQVAYENMGFRATQGTIFIEERLFPLSESKVSSALIGFFGFMQYNIVFPKNVGAEAADKIETALKDAFAPGVSSSHNGLDVCCDRVEGELAVDFENFGNQVTGDWSSIAVQVTIRAYQNV